MPAREELLRELLVELESMITRIETELGAVGEEEFEEDFAEMPPPPPGDLEDELAF